MLQRGLLLSWLFLGGAIASAQEPPALAKDGPPPPGTPGADAVRFTTDAVAPTSHEISAEDVPDHDPRICRRWLVGAEYNLWLIKKASTPPLVTTGRNTDPLAGALSSASTRVVYGGDINLNERNGARFTLGYFLDDAEATRVEAVYAFAGDKRVGFTIGSLGTLPGFPVLARPFFNAQTNAEDASLVAFPGLSTGFLDVRYNSFFDSGELNFACNAVNGCATRLDWLAGFRFCRLRESLAINEADVINPGSPRFAGQLIQVHDDFATDNTFYGAQVGLRGTWHYKRWALEAGAKVALGFVDRDIDIHGYTISNGAPPLNVPAGLLALSTNSGHASSVDFAVVPEASLQIGYRFTDNIQVYFGYTFFYWNQVYRPGDQVDRVLNPNLIPTSTTFGVPGGPARPAAVQVSNDVWLHALRFGVEFKF
ncbi:MAG: BBP7 family outer membrane beta-barrel protein [Gemmataceae bacterium]